MTSKTKGVGTSEAVANVVENATNDAGADKAPEILDHTTVKVTVQDWAWLKDVLGKAGVTKDTPEIGLAGLGLRAVHALKADGAPLDAKIVADVTDLEAKAATHRAVVDKHAALSMWAGVVRAAQEGPNPGLVLQPVLKSLGLADAPAFWALVTEGQNAQAKIVEIEKSVTSLRASNISAALVALKGTTAKKTAGDKPAGNGYSEGWYTSRGYFLYVNASGIARLVDVAQAYVSPEFKVTSRQSLNVAAHTWQAGGLEAWIKNGAKNTGVNCGSSSERVTGGGQTKEAMALYVKEVYPDGLNIPAWYTEREVKPA